MIRQLHAEWTKLRTVRGWVVTMALGFVVIVGLGLAPGPGGTCSPDTCSLPIGPDGDEVTDSFTFAHRSLTGDGSITARVASFTGELPSFDPGAPTRPGLVPWAKAGLIIKDGVTQGSSYAAVMTTGGHGVRMQYDFTHDLTYPGTGPPGPWLRLTRTGDTVTGAASADGVTWSTVAAVRMPGLPSTVEAGLFLTSPQYTEISREVVGLTGASGGPSSAAATFESVDTQGGWAAGDWTGEQIGRGGDRGPEAPPPGTVERSGDAFTLTGGSGDIAPAVAGTNGLGLSLTQTLVGTFLGLVFVLVVATMSVTAEYRRGLIRTTVAASPHRGRILAAKAAVVGAVAFVVGLVAATVVVTAGRAVLVGNGAYVSATPTATVVRMVLGTGALLAVAAVLGVALGALVRRSAVGVTLAMVTVVLPYLLAVTVLSDRVGDRLLSVTPAAAFAVQQSTREYAQVDNLYTVAGGYFPLAPGAGFAVLVGWTALTMAGAWYRLRKADA
jgi:ABC-type transport system involved in multi-copper enzyme maturation permease subunit